MFRPHQILLHDWCTILILQFIVPAPSWNSSDYYWILLKLVKTYFLLNINSLFPSFPGFLGLFVQYCYGVGCFCCAWGLGMVSYEHYNIIWYGTIWYDIIYYNVICNEMWYVYYLIYVCYFELFVLACDFRGQWIATCSLPAELCASVTRCNCCSFSNVGLWSPTVCRYHSCVGWIYWLHRYICLWYLNLTLCFLLLWCPYYLLWFRMCGLHWVSDKRIQNGRCYFVWPERVLYI
jgi:hypothetical protein